MAVSVEDQQIRSTLDEVLSRYGLERKDLERKCPARVRLEIAEHLGDWKMAGRYLNIDPQKLDDIQVKYHTEERRRVALLDAWDEREGEETTYLKVTEVFHHGNRTDLVEKLCEKIKSRGVELSVQGGVNKDEVKSGQITSPDRLFNDLAFMICDKYMEIGVELGLKHKSLYNELETGLFAMKRGNEKAVKMLEMWQQFIGEDHFTYSVLANALEKYGFHKAAREFCYTKTTSNLQSNLQKSVEKHGGPTADSRRNPSLMVAKVHVKQRLDSLEEEITKLSSQLCHEVEKNGVTIEHLLNKLTMLPVALRREFQDSLRRDIATFGDTCKSISHAFHLLINPLTTFLDYKLLEHLISKFGSSQLNQAMADYVDDVNNFKRETTVAELMDHWDGVEDESMKFTELQVRFGEDPMKCTLERLDRFRKKFCSRYKLSELVMILIHLKPGSFIAFWRIPTVLVGNITESVSQRDDPFFDEEKILSISVTGKQIFPLSSDEATGLAIKDLPTAIDEDQASGYEYVAELHTFPERFNRLQVGKYDHDTVSTSDSGVGSTASSSVYSADSEWSESSETWRPRRQPLEFPLIKHRQVYSQSPESWRPSRQELQLPHSISSVNVEAECRRLLGGKLTWREGERAPQKVYSINNAVAYQYNVLFINCDQTILVYDASCSTNNWSRLPDCPVGGCSLVVVNDLLTTIGGTSGLQSATNKLFSFTGEGGDKTWTEEFPPMPTKRCWSTALCTGTSLIVAGGKETILSTTLTTVEVMNTETHQWSTAADLPVRMTGLGCVITSTICGDQFIVISGYEVYKCPLTALLQACTSLSSHNASELQSNIKPSVQWNRVADIPERFPTCVSLNGQLLAISGDYHTYNTPVYMYNSVSNSWTIIGYKSTGHNRWYCYAAVLPNNQLVVVGGIETDSVEIATLT